MPKIFSDIEKDIQRNTLFEKGLQMIVERGYKNVTVDELVTLIGSSKGYFYRLFESKEEFFLQAISWQMTQNLEILTAARSNGASTDELSQLYKELFMQASTINYIDMFYIYSKVSEAQWKQFRDFEESHYIRVVKLLGKDPTICEDVYKRQVFNNASLIRSRLFRFFGGETSKSRLILLLLFTLD